MNNFVKSQQIISKQPRSIVLSTFFLFVFGLGITPIITGSQLNQAIQNANEVYQLSEKTQYYADGEIPSYDVNQRIGVAGVESYRNINQSKYGEIEWIEAAKGELLITLKEGTPLYEIGIIADKYNLKILKRYQKIRPAFRLRLVSTGENTINPLEIIAGSTQQSNGELESVWRGLDSDSRLLTVDLNATVYPDASDWDGGWWPNDNQINPPPGVKGELAEIGAHKAWRELQEAGMDPGGNEDIWMAVIDSGVDLNHPDLKDNIATDPSLVSSDNPNGWVGKYFGIYDCNDEELFKDVLEPCKGWMEFGGTDGGFPGDPDYHGTFVAGIAAERGENSLTATGVAHGVKIVPITTYTSVELNIFVEPIINSINYVASLDRVRVINISLGVFSQSNVGAFEQAINDAFAIGKIIIASAGNEGLEIDKYPASYNNVISVSSESLNFGKWIDIASITSNIRSTKYNDVFGLPGSNNNPPPASSWGVPQVAGSIALLISRYPNLSTQDIIDITLQRPDTFYYEHGSPNLGCGIVNPGRMLTSLAPLIVWDESKVKEYGPQCVRRFRLGEDIRLEWRHFPPEGDSDRYWIRYWRKGDDPSEPIDAVSATEQKITWQDAELFEDGTWYWQIGAEYDGEIHWTSDQTIKKHVGTKITSPAENTKITNTTTFKWDPIENAKNYFLSLHCPAMNNNILWRVPLNTTSTTHAITQEEYDTLKSFDYASCSFGIVGTAYDGNYDLESPELYKVKYPYGQVFLLP